MKPKHKTHNTARGMYCMGFRFTPEECRMMRKAEKEAAERMRTFGQGTGIPMIDRTKYISLCSN